VMGGSYAIHQGFSAMTFWSHSLLARMCGRNSEPPLALDQ
jgi:hypothetical protein